MICQINTRTIFKRKFKDLLNVQFQIIIIKLLQDKDPMEQGDSRHPAITVKCKLFYFTKAKSDHYKFKTFKSDILEQVSYEMEIRVKLILFINRMKDFQINFNTQRTV